MAFTKIAAAGIGSTETVTLHSLEVLNNATVGGVLTYEDVTNVDSIGIVTARAGVLVGSGITLSKDGDIFATGVTTTGSLVSNGAVSGTTGTFSGAISGTTGTFTDNLDVATSIRHIGDTDTKISFDTNIIHLDTNNEERIRIDSNGRLTSSTSTARASAGVSGMIQVETADGNGAINIVQNQNTAAGSPSLVLAKSRGTSVNSNTVVANNDTLGNIKFAGADGTDLNTPAAQITGQVDGTPGSNDMPGRLLFYTTADGSSSLTERVRITSTGSVGIGTETVSGAKLDVIDGIINVGAAVTTADARIQFTRKASGMYSWIGIPNWNPNALYIYGPKDSNPYNEPAALYESSTWQFLTGGTARVQINPTGSLNIRNTSGYSTYDVDISNAATTDTAVQIRPNDGNAGEAQLFIGGGGTNQNKCAIIFDPAGGYCRGNLHFCMENTADTSNVDSTDKKLSISPEGYVTKSSQPAFLVLPANNAETADGDVTYTSVNHNTGGHYSTSTGRFTAPVTGYYSFFANYTGDAGCTSCQVKFKINGAINAVGNHYSGGSPTSWGTNPYMSCDLSGTHVYLSANDYVQLNLVANGASQGQAAYMRFFGYMLH